MTRVKRITLLTVASLVLLFCLPAEAKNSSKLRFVAQLDVNGCAVFVHATGFGRYPSLEVEPILCVTDDLQSIRPTFDTVTQHTYLSIPIVMRDDEMLEEVRRQLPSFRRVRFASVRSVKIVKSASSYKALSFVWSPLEPNGYLRLKYIDKQQMAIYLRMKSFRFRRFIGEIMMNVLLKIELLSDGAHKKFEYYPRLKNVGLIDPNFHAKRYKNEHKCSSIGFVRTINFESCTARVHKTTDLKEVFLIEPLLCHNITSLSSESVKYDYSRDMHYLKLDLVLQDDATLDAVRTQLADLSPRSVEFMRLWLAEMSVSSALSARFEIGPLMVSADWRSAQLRVFCTSATTCPKLISVLSTNPINFWRHITWSVRSLQPGLCEVASERHVYSWRMKELEAPPVTLSCDTICQSFTPNGTRHRFLREISDGRLFVSIQQRLTGRVSFQRNWTDYENGFGDETDFWIGLEAIHSLSSSGTTLRVEMKLWNGTELYAEYDRFQVGSAKSRYSLSPLVPQSDRSSLKRDLFTMRGSTLFLTSDKENSGSSNSSGKAGWWFGFYPSFNPNGLYPSNGTTNSMMEMTVVCCFEYEKRLALREVRMMLRV